MKRCVAVAFSLLIALATPASAHQLDEYVQATKISVGKDVVRVELRLTPGVKVLPSVLAQIDTDRDGRISSAEQRAYAERVMRDLSLVVDGRRLPLRLVTLQFPDVADMKDGLGEIEMEFSSVVPRGGVERALTFENRHRFDVSVYLANALVPADAGIRIGEQRRSYDQSSFTFDYAQGAAAGPGGLSSVREASGYLGMVRLGMRHIAEGTDHLLFLLVLLLPAPLVAVAGRWAGYSGVRDGVRPRNLRILGSDSGSEMMDLGSDLGSDPRFGVRPGVRPRFAGVRPGLKTLLRIVTAFTIGHSLTLVAAATGLVRAPAGIVEVLVATSILVSAIHALRPIFPGREALVAGGFGLVHGLAFATTIAGYGIDPWHTVLAVLGFNTGIEVMQLAIVVATVPWLLSLARTPAYGFVRVGGALVAGVAALGWIGERAFGVANPIGPAVEGAADHGPVLVVALALGALGASAWDRTTSRRSPV